MSNVKALEMHIDRFFVKRELRRRDEVVIDRGLQVEFLLRGGEHGLGVVASDECEGDERCDHGCTEVSSAVRHDGSGVSHARCMQE